MAYDSKLISSVLRVFLGVVKGWYGKQGKALGITECRGGSVTFAQRFGSALNLNPHFHSLVVDGIFNEKNANFHEGPPLRDEDVKQIVETVAHRVIRLLERQGVLDGDGYGYDELAVLAPHAKNREAVVPKKPNEEELRKTRGNSKNRILWAALLARTRC